MKRVAFHFFLVVVFAQIPNCSTDERERQCSNYCICKESQFVAKCNFKGFQSQSVVDLYGPDFNSILHLELFLDDVQHLNTTIFKGLHHLKTLKLKISNLTSIHGNITSDLHSLEVLNVTTDGKWLPNKQILSLQNLREIHGVWWREECGVCTLFKFTKDDQDQSKENECNDYDKDKKKTDNNCEDDEDDKNKEHNEDNPKEKDDDDNGCKNEAKKTNKTSCDEMNLDSNKTCNEKSEKNIDKDEKEGEDQIKDIIPGEFLYPNDIKYGQGYQFFKFRFMFECQHQTMCVYFEYSIPADTARFRVFFRMIYLQYALGTAAMAVNFVIIATIIIQEKLRASPSFVLLAIVALNDFLTGTFSVLQAIFKSFYAILSHDIANAKVVESDEFQCYISGVIFTIAQISSPITSLLLTIERYLVIVYSFQPERRLTRKLAIISSLFVYVTAVVIATLPSYTESIKYQSISHCTLPNVFETEASKVTRYLVYAVTLCLLVPYITGIILYQRIYINVKKSGQQMGNRKDMKVAKNIAMIVVSNLVFFVIPTLLLYIHANFYENIPDVFRKTLTTERIYLSIFASLPLQFFNINACLNPFLFAFRNQTFQQQFKSMITGSFSMFRRFVSRKKITHMSNQVKLQVTPIKSRSNNALEMEDKSADTKI